MKKITSARWVQVDLNAYDDAKYSGNGGRSWVSRDSSNLDTWDSYAAAVADGRKSFKPSYVFKQDWDVIQLPGSIFKDRFGKDLSERAEQIADDLSEFLKDVTMQLNQGDYFDEYDMEDLGRSTDALYDFAQAYNHGLTSADIK